MNIIGYRYDVRLDALKHWAYEKSGSKEFIILANIYDRVCKEMNCNQVVAFVQCAKETGFLYKNGSAAGLDASFHNPCGLKVTKGGGDFDHNAHMRFKTWEDGIRAHIDHLLLYAGAEGYPKKDTLDPRHFPYLYGTAHNRVEELNDKWTSGPYGDKLVEMANEILSITDEQLYPELKMENYFNKVIENSGPITILDDVVAVEKTHDNGYFTLIDILERYSELSSITSEKSLIYYQLKPLFDKYTKESRAHISDEASSKLRRFCNENFYYKRSIKEYYVKYHITNYNGKTISEIVNTYSDDKFITYAVIISAVFGEERFDHNAFNLLINYINKSIGESEINIEISSIIFGG